MALSDNLAVLLQVKADTNSAVRGLGRVETAVHSLRSAASAAGSGDLSGLAGSLATLTAGAGPAGIAIGVIAGGIALMGGAAVAATKELFDLSVQAAEFGAKIYDASVQTGMSAEALSSLQVAAKQSDVEFSKIITSITKFSVMVGNAADGSKTAQASLAKFGLTAKEAMGNTDAAFAKVVKKIAELPPGIQKSALAAEAFGARGGKDMLKLIDQMDGDLPGLIAKMKAMGMTIGGEAAAAADRFKDKMDLLGMRFDMIKVKIGTELMPSFERLFDRLGDWLDHNSDKVQVWGRALSKVLDDIIAGVEKAVNFINAHPFIFKVLIGGPGLWILERYFGAKLADAKADQDAGVTDGDINTDPNAPGSGFVIRNSASTGGSSSGVRRGGGTSKDARTQGELKKLQADIASEKEKYDAALEKARKGMEKTEVSAGLFRVPTSDEIAASVQSGLDAINLYYSTLVTKEQEVYEKNLKLAKTQDEKDALTTENTTRIKQRARERAKEEEQIREEGKDAEFKIVQEANKRELDALDDKNSTELAMLKDSLDQGLVTQEEYARREGEINASKLALRKKQLQDIIAQESTGNVPLEELQAAKDELVKINGEIARNEVETQGQIRAARAETEAQRRQIINDTIDALNRMRVAELEAGVAEARANVDRSVNKKRTVKELLKAELDLAEEQHRIRLLELRRARNAELEKKGLTEADIALIKDKYRKLSDEEDKAYTRTRQGIYDTNAALAKSPWEKWSDDVRKNIANVGSATANLSNMIFDSFQKMGQALETAIGRWILYGESIGKAMKKALAEELATIAARAAMWALYSTALGFYNLAMGHKDEAKDAFTAAGIYTAVAVAAGAGARALAKSAFSDESNKATGKSQTSRTAGAQGQAYSGKDATSVTAGRGAVTSFKPEIVITDRSGMFSQLFEAEIKNNTKVRSLIVQTANS